MTQRADSTAARVRALFADVLELIQVRLELFGVEAREDVGNLISLVVQSLLAVALFSFGLIFLALWLTLMLWDSHPLLALGAFAALFLGGGLVLALLAWHKLRRGLRLFGGTVAELRRDQRELRS